MTHPADYDEWVKRQLVWREEGAAEYLDWLAYALEHVL